MSTKPRRKVRAPLIKHLYAMAVLAIGFGGTAHATIIVDNTGANPVCTVSNVTLASGSADACAGWFEKPGNTVAETTKLNDVTDGSDWEFVYKVGDTETTGPGSFGGIDITLINPDIKNVNGVWTIEWSDPDSVTPLNLPLVLDIAAGFKAGSGTTKGSGPPQEGGMAYFMFEGFTLTDNPFSSNGTFDLIAVGKGLSHESLFVRLGAGTPPTQFVPEPATLFLMGLGLAGLGFARRRRNA